MIVVVTDGDDCSARDTSLFRPDGQLDADDPLKDVGLSVRCSQFPEYLHDVTTRYAEAFKALRAAREQHFIYGVIAGVPKDLVDATARAAVDFADPMQRDAYYDGILSDSRMQQVVVEGAMVNDARLSPSCDTVSGTATPPVRLVQLAKAMGEQAVVSSLCDTDLADAVTPLIEKVAARKDPSCMHGLPAREQGVVPCDVVWELPLPGRAPAATPIQCSQMPFLAEADRYPSDPDGRERCVVTQLPFGGEADSAPLGEGWYFDEASDELARACPAGDGRIAFTPYAKPPTGVTVYLDCGSNPIFD
jgi:hypothetical protein